MKPLSVRDFKGIGIDRPEQIEEVAHGVARLVRPG
jgi:hypothetical protein